VKEGEAMTTNKIGAFVGPVPEMNNFTGKKGPFYVIALV
jgi:hypothetical protein